MCLTAMSKNQLVFSEDEIKSVCCKVDSVPGAINCFGLLQAVEHISSTSGMPTKTFNFIHFSVQEFLAAYQITYLDPKDELAFIRNNFFSEFYANTFAMYVGFTKGQHSSFKKFLSTYSEGVIDRALSFFSTRKITKRFFDDHRKSLWLFQCFHEANDQESCDSITEELRAGGVIDLYCSAPNTLLPSELHTLIVFLTNSRNKKWLRLRLLLCHIGDAGLKLLHQSLHADNIIIEEISLSHNSLTTKSTQEVADIATFCKTKRLNVSYNQLSDGLDLSSNSTLVDLYMEAIQLNSGGARNLFSSLLKNNRNTKVTLLDLCDNYITDEALPELVSFLTINKSLEKMHLGGNYFTKEGQKVIITSLVNNKTLTFLGLGTPDYTILGLLVSFPEYILESQKLVNDKRESNLKLKIN